MPAIYKIQHTPSGRFSTGGQSPRWSTKGKVWVSKAALSSHLTLVDPSEYKDCVVLEFEVTHTQTSTTPVSTLLQAKQDARKKKEATRLAAQALATEKAEREHLARLQAKYPKP
jgi:hypothetical protein